MTTPPEDFVARYAPARLLLMLCGAIAFVALGLWIGGAFGEPPRPGKEIWGWLAAGLFGLCACAIAPRLGDRDDQLRISPSGIQSKPWSDDLIPWSQISRISVWEHRNQRSILLHLLHPERFPSQRLLGKLAAANRALTGGDVAITLTGTDRTFDDAMRAIERFAPTPR